MYQVLIVEDEDITRKGLVYGIEWDRLGCVVVGEARNGAEGVEAIKTYHPDLVLADINMPVMDGMEMLEKTYQEYEYAAIILSGYSTFSYAQKAIKYGVLDYLLKPLDMDELEESILKMKREIEKRQIYRRQVQGREKFKEIILLPEEDSDSEKPLVKEMLTYIRNHYKEKVLMKDVALQLNYSEYYLNRKFKETMKTTFMEYLNRYRIQKALELMKEGGWKIQDIAWECGVGEYKYFNVVFKKYLGCSPKEYIRFLENRKK